MHLLSPLCVKIVYLLWLFNFSQLEFSLECPPTIYKYISSHLVLLQEEDIFGTFYFVKHGLFSFIKI